MNRYILKITGKNPDYFLKKIVNKKIELYEVKLGSKWLIIEVDSAGYKDICNIKTSYDIEIVDVKGILKVKEVISKYFFFILFFCIGIVINIFLSNIIFEVEVVHPSKYIRDIVYDDLEYRGIKKFAFKVSFNKKEQIEKAILEEEKKDIEWLEIESIGTKYVVKVEQRKLDKEKDKCNNRNIVAKKNAMIIDIIAESGEVIKKKNDYVLKDEIVISGVIHNKENIVNNKCAIGKIFGEVWYSVKVELPVEYVDVNVTGKNKYQLRFDFLDKKFILFNKFDTYKIDDLFVYKNKLLPVGVSFSKYFETDVKKYTYTLNNCNDKALSLAENKILDKLEGASVVSKKVLKKEIKNSKIVVEVFVKVREDITAYQDITLEPLE